MGFLKNLFGSGSSTSQNRNYTFKVKCDRCGEVIEGRVDLNNDLSVEYEGNESVYFGRKVLMGSGRCFQQIEVELKFNASKQLLEKNITGGSFTE